MSTRGKRKNTDQDEPCNFHGLVVPTLLLFLDRVISTSYRSTLFVSNLPYTATSTDLNTLFSDFAPVRSAFVVLEHVTGTSKGVGYVSFAIPEDASVAFNTCSTDGIILDGRKLRVEWATNKVCPRAFHSTYIYRMSTLA
jgi:RNA recognition motif-containing protein